MPGEAENRQEQRKQRTRAAIQEAALELFSARGYRETTISQVAEAADVALRTVTIHFPTKAALLFEAEPFSLASLTAQLERREAGVSALDAVRLWMAESMRALGTAAADVQRRVWQRRADRARVIAADDELRALARAGYYPYEQVLARHIATDLGQSADALAPRLAATCVITGLRELYLTREARAVVTDDPTESLLSLVDAVIGFASAGIGPAESRG